MKPPTPTLDKAEVVLAIGACWLAFRGKDPQVIGARALRAAEGIRTMLARLEQLTETQAREAMGCKRSLACDCLWCREKRKDNKAL